MFRGSYSIHILKTNSWHVQRKLQHRYLKNRLVSVQRKLQYTYCQNIWGVQRNLHYTYRQNKLVGSGSYTINILMGCSEEVTVYIILKTKS